MIAEHELQAINAVRSELGALLKNANFDTDFDILRFLQGFDMKLETVIPKLREHLRYRIASGDGESATTINSACKSVFGQCCPDPPVFSKQGYLLYIEFMGKTDIFGAVRDGRYCCSDLYQYRTHELDAKMNLVREREAITGKQGGIYMIWDVDGFNYDASTVIGLMNRAMKQWIEFFTKHNVENFKTVTIINASPVIYRIYSVIRGLLPARTRQKVKVLSPSDWKAELLEDFSIDDLPDFYGGNLVIDKTDPTVFVPGGKIDEKHYYDIESQDFKDYLKFSVGSGRALIAKFHVENDPTNGSIEYEFFTNAGAHFGIYHLRNDATLDPDTADCVTPEYKPLLVADCRPEKGFVPINRKGAYFVRLYNDAFWIFSAMTVHIKVDCQIDGVQLEPTFVVT